MKNALKMPVPDKDRILAAIQKTLMEEIKRCLR